MEFEEELAKTGLHEYEILIIKELEERKLTAKEISEKTKVPMGRIYEFLNKLIEKKLISYEISNPSYYYTDNLEKRIIDYLDKLYLKKIENQNKLFELIEKEKTEIKPVYTTESFDKIIYKEREASETRHIKRIRRDTSYPFLLFPDDYSETAELLACLHGKDKRFYEQEKVKKEIIYQNEHQHMTYSSKPTQLMISEFSINKLFSKIKEEFGEKYALSHLNKVMETLIEHPLLEFRISKERFPYHLFITNNSVVIALKEEKEMQKELVGTYFRGGEIVRKYPLMFNLKFEKATPFKEYSKKLKEKIRR